MKTATPDENNYEQFPSKSYKRRKNKVNILLHKMENDAGYPENILKYTSEAKSDDNDDKNYLDLNTKNLKNFFAERIPKKQQEIYKLGYTIEPSRLFDIKRKQYEMKLQTKITLDNTIDSNLSISTIQPRKITETFLVKDKNRQFRKKFLQEQNKKPHRFYEDNNYRKGTKSYLQKYANIIKKQAYVNTFGFQQSLIETPYETSRKSASAIMGSTNRPVSLNQNRFKKRQKQKQQKLLKNQKKFSSTIYRLDQQRKTLDPDDRAHMKPYTIRQFKSDQMEKEGKKQLIKWISSATKQYKKKVVDGGVQNMEEMEDLKKMNKKFYEELLRHKSNRLKVREYQVLGSKNVQSHRTSRVGNSFMSDTQTQIVDKFESKIKDDIQHVDDLSISYCSSQESLQYQQQALKIKGNWGSEKKLSIIEKFQKFGQLLVKTLYMAKLYNIKDKNNVYRAFWQNHQPYELQGSYAFFKALKLNDLEGIKKFTKINDDYIYEKDHKGRSPLIYACINNQTAIAKYFLQHQINVDLQDKNKKTALYYALKNQNITLTEILLKKGCDPWSKPSCSYKQILENTGNIKIQRLMKNARKIWIAMLPNTDRASRHRLWTSLKDQINAKTIIKFE